MTDNNIINFPRIGFARPVGGQTPPPPPSSPPSAGGPSARRSPLQIAAGSTANPPAVRQPGHAPTTFRSPAPDHTGPRLGALSMAAILAVSVAALRGTVQVLQDRRQRRMQRELEHAPLRAARLKNQLAMEQVRYAIQEAAAKAALDRRQAREKHANAMQSIGDKSAEQRAKNNKVPSSHEFGRKTLGDKSRRGQGSGVFGGGKSKGAGRGSGGGGSSDGKGSGSGKSGSKNSPQGRGGGLKKNAGGPESKAKRNGGGSGASRRLPGSGGGRGLGSGGKNSKRDTDGGGGAKAPNRLSQGGTKGALKKQRQKNVDQGAGGKGRTRLPKALAKDANKAANKRLKRRRKNLDNPVLWNDARKNQKKQRERPTTAGPSEKEKQPKAKTPKARREPDMSKLSDALWADTKTAADGRWRKRRQNGTGVPPLWKNDKKRDKKARKPRNAKPKAEQAGPGRGERWRRARDRARNAWPGRGAWAKDGCFDGASPGTGTAGGSARRSPFDNVPRDAAEWTFEREDYVGAQAKRWEPDGIAQAPQALPADGPAALPAAPEPQFARPGTTRPEPAPPAPTPPAQEMTSMTAPPPATTGRAPAMDPQHATEITHDEAVDGGIKLMKDGLATHQQSQILARRARKLRDTLRAFAEHLAVQNNVIGPLFSGAMASLGESMDVLARMADEMENRSWRAAENAEVAANEMEDAYRPITQATADAGLTTPSAPAHNET